MAPFLTGKGWEGDPHRFVTWWRRTHFKDSMIDAVISVEEAGYFKPHHATYAKACELLGVDRSSVLFVANHAFDCIGAKACGMRTAVIDRRRRPFGDSPHQPVIVKDFAELG